MREPLKKAGLISAILGKISLFGTAKQAEQL